ncbi:MAG: LysM peptidoglycan-binding domain-containing protein [Pleurocapsa sp. SU_196_0]|nr:LysM peptidoglycan-binding domain-containing protein [Pleurocapsa sp. SU_196_0]
MSLAIAATYIVKPGDTLSSIARQFNVTITDLTVSDGAATVGAGIILGSEILALDNVTIQNNVASGDGGGLWAPRRRVRLLPGVDRSSQRRRSDLEKGIRPGRRGVGERHGLKAVDRGAG